MLTPTFPPDDAAPASFRPSVRAFAAIAVICTLLAAAAASPARFPAMLAAIGARTALAAVWWASIVLTSMPFVTAGALAAALAQRIPRLRGWSAAVALMFSPGCDCSIAGFAPVLRRTSPATAGFAIAWSAAAGPAALIATHSVLGNRLLLARIAGAVVTAALTALLWSISPKRCAAEESGAHETEAPLVERIRSSVAGLAASAFAATMVLAAAPNALAMLSSPFAAAVVGSLLSPCSTADAVLARVLVHDRAGQAAFLIAAQCVDVRQLATLHRVFGLRRMLLAAAAGCLGCVAAAFCAR